MCPFSSWHYWKRDCPYLDGIEFTIIPNRSTAILAFMAGKVDMTFPFEVSIPLLNDVKAQAPQAICELAPANSTVNLIVNREKPPVSDARLRRAMALALDRKAFVDILAQGKSDIGASMLPPPAGVWGMPPQMLKSIPGYDPDVAANRAEARTIMEGLGYGAKHRLASGGDLLVAVRQGPRHHGQQPIQRLPLRRRVAGQVAQGPASRCGFAAVMHMRCALRCNSVRRSARQGLRPRSETARCSPAGKAAVRLLKREAGTLPVTTAIEVMPPMQALTRGPDALALSFNWLLAAGMRGRFFRSDGLQARNKANCG